MIHSQMRFVLAALLFAVVTALVPTSASAYQSAPLNFCNNTSDPVGVAVGYHSPGVKDPADHSVLTGPFVSRGWWLVTVGACQTLDNPFGARYMFWFAEPIRNNDLKLPPSANGLSNTPDDFCVSNWLSPRGAPSFTYEDENVSLKACESPDKDPIPVWITPHSVDTWIDPNVSFTRQ